MRNFEKGLISYAYFMGTFLFALNKYVKENKSFALSKDTTLYRIIQCSEIDFYLYKLNLGHIICFPALTSTSSKPIKFKPTKLALKANNISNNLIKVKMIFTYKHEKGNISPGIIIDNKKGHDNKPLTKYNENEVILFPFTFVRIKQIKEISKKEFEISFDIINRKKYIEIALRDNVQNREKFSSKE